MKGTWQGTDEIDLALELMDVHHVEVRDAVSLEDPAAFASSLRAADGRYPL